MAGAGKVMKELFDKEIARVRCQGAHSNESRNREAAGLGTADDNRGSKLVTEPITSSCPDWPQFPLPNPAYEHETVFTPKLRD